MWETFVKKQVFYRPQVFLEKTLPKEGEILAKEGDLVKPFDILGYTYVSPLQRQLKIPPGSKILVSQGEDVVLGQVLAKKSGFIGGQEFKAPIAGAVSLKDDRIEISSSPEKFNLVSGIEAKVVKVIAKLACLLVTEATYVKGVWAGGQEAVGEVKVIQKGGEVIRQTDLSPSDVGKILIYPGFVPLSILQKAKALGVAGFVCASAEVSLKTPEGCPINLLLTEVFGSLRMPSSLFSFFESLTLRTAVISPPRRQLIIPGYRLEKTSEESGFPPIGTIEKGLRVQILVWPHLGEEAQVTEVLGDSTFESGVKTSAVLVKLAATGKTLKVATSNILILE